MDIIRDLTLIGSAMSFLFPLILRHKQVSVQKISASPFPHFSNLFSFELVPTTPSSQKYTVWEK